MRNLIVILLGIIILGFSGFNARAEEKIDAQFKLILWIPSPEFNIQILHESIFNIHFDDSGSYCVVNPRGDDKYYPCTATVKTLKKKQKTKHEFRVSVTRETLVQLATLVLHSSKLGVTGDDEENLLKPEISWSKLKNKKNKLVPIFHVKEKYSGKVSTKMITKPMGWTTRYNIPVEFQAVSGSKFIVTRE